MSSEESTSSKEIRRARVRRLVRRLLIWVVAPTMIGVIYFGIVASAQYESTALISLQTNAQGKASQAKHEALQVKEFALSHAMLETLVGRHDLLQQFQDSNIDRFSRLSSDASSEELYSYFRDHVRIEYQSSSGSLRITVRAFTPESAQAIVQAMVSEIEVMVGTMGAGPAADRLQLVEENVDLAKTQLESAILASTLAEQSLTQAEEAASNLPNLRAARDTAIAWQGLAQERLRSSLIKLDTAQEEELAQRLYIAVVSAPSPATGSVHPRRLWSITTVFVLSLVFMAVVTMLASAVKEHARF